MIIVKNLRKYFSNLKAIDGVSFEIKPGETFGLVGESGSGKSTLGKTLLCLEEPSSGEVFFEGENISLFSSKERKEFRKKAQVIFQDPYASLNPRMTVEDILKEPFEIHGIEAGPEKIAELLQLVHLDPAFAYRFPHELSGGQKQRIGIARALALMPKFIVCDEPISSLDVSVQAQIVLLLKKLQAQFGLTYLFISHDLRMVKYISSRIAVMYLGHIVEIAPTAELFLEPLHPYTEALLSAIPLPDPKLERTRTRIFLPGEPPSPSNPPKGCAFCTRCPKAMPICHEVKPALQQIHPGHRVACHLYQ